MPNLDDNLKNELLEANYEFRRLYEEHQDCDRRLQAVYEKPFRSQEDETIEKQIKLHKLTLKDRMHALIRDHREARLSA